MKKIISLVGSALLILCAFLPYATVDFMGMSESTSLIEGGDGYFFIILAAIALVFVLLNKKIPVLIASILALALMIFEVVDYADKIGGSGLDSYINKGAGYFLMIAGAVVLFIGAIIGMIKKQD